MKRKNMEGIPATGRRDNGKHHAEKVAAAAANPHNITIYDNDIELYADEYIQRMKDPDSIYNNHLAFAGMMRYIYNHVFRPHETLLYNSNSTIDSNNTQLLNHVWNIYTGLCYQYGTMPTIQRFSMMTGIDFNTIHTWETGQQRAGTGAHSRMVKQWRAECESALYDADGNQTIKSIFLLKSKYGYVEAAQPVQVVNPLAPKMTAEQLEDLIDNDPPQLPDD